MKKLRIAGLAALVTMACAPAFAQLTTTGICPNTVPFGGVTTDCNALITLNGDGSISTSFNSTTTYDGIEDALIGVLNNSGKPLSSLYLSEPGSDIFGFDGDGIDTYIAGAGNLFDTSGYGGNDAYFSGIDGALDSGTVNFITPLSGDGGNTYFSLEDLINVDNAPSISTGLPEPTSIALIGLGLIGAGIARRRR